MPRAQQRGKPAVVAFLLLMSGLGKLSAPAPAAVGAGNYNFLDRTPYAQFTEEDKSLFNQALHEALNKTPDNETLTWSNPNTGSGGELTPLDTAGAPGRSCRHIEVINKAKGQAEKGRWSLCKQADGRWMPRSQGK